MTFPVRHPSLWHVSDRDRREGSTAGIEELFRAHNRLVFGYLLRPTGDASVAEDLAQETFLRATRAILGRRGGPPRAWLLAIARNVLMDEVRRGRRLLPIEEELLPARTEDLGDDAAVRDILRRLPSHQARLLVLIHMDGFTHGEVAAMTGADPGSVKTAVWRAREAFRAAYEREERS